MSSEKERKLSVAEQRRKEKFDALCVKMEQEGYRNEWIGRSELASVLFTTSTIRRSVVLWRL